MPPEKLAYLIVGVLVGGAMSFRVIASELPHGFATRASSVEFAASFTFALCLGIGGAIAWPLVLAVEVIRYLAERRERRRLVPPW